MTQSFFVAIRFALPPIAASREKVTPAKKRRTYSRSICRNSMMSVVWKFRARHLLLLLVALVALSGKARAQVEVVEDEEQQTNGPFHAIQEKYEDLPPAGKFVATAAVGFVGSRVALKTFVRVAKVGGAAFIASEVLSASGAMDEMPSFVDDHVQTVASAKDRVVSGARKFRRRVRESLKKERMAALGFAAGAFVGMAL
jgi:hypothetical protein